MPRHQADDEPGMDIPDIVTYDPEGQAKGWHTAFMSYG